MSRYEDAEKWVGQLVRLVRQDHFPELADARIKIVMDAQKRKGRGRYVMGTLKLASSMVNYLAEEEIDYLLVLDKSIFERLEEADRLHLLFHLLCFAWKDVEDGETAWKLAPADYEVFTREMEFNRGWQDWNRRMSKFAAEVHESKNPPEVNHPDHPRLPLEGGTAVPEADKPRRDDLQYPICNRFDQRAQLCGFCDDDDCDGCCLGCDKQAGVAGTPTGCAHATQAGEAA